MHPAPSVIAFTALSGAGYGLLFLLSLGYLLQLPWSADAWAFGIGLAVALGFITVGLLASTRHLRRPERAWRAVTQWRSSWLSREGVFALATFPPAAGLLLTGPLLGMQGWLPLLCALLSVIGAAATVLATAMIYASLKPIRQWHHPKVPPLYLLLALASGAPLLSCLLAFEPEAAPLAFVAAGLLLVAWVMKQSYWRDIDRSAPLATLASATGLQRKGDVTLLEPPHTQDNYLTEEMGYRVARKHSGKLRLLALGFALAALVCLVFAGLSGGGWTQLFFSLPAALLALVAVGIERWLFFAEATHTVSLYYGKAA
ncbi:MAG: DmsC/YnfH family molybdoenzyme membrane anchor subunit [Pseudomonadota bacterium]